MSSSIPDVSNFGEMSARQFTLQAETEIELPRYLQRRIDRVDLAEHRNAGRTSTEGIREIAILNRDAGHKRREILLRVHEIAFRLVVEQAGAAANHGRIVHRIRRAEPRHEEMRRVIQPARRASWDNRHGIWIECHSAL